MDSLKSLIDKQNYDLVIKLTENSESASDFFYRIAAFTCLGKYEEGLNVIQDHQEMLEKENLNSLIHIHIELLCALERFDQAYSILDYYSNLPYQSQIVEETLQKMPEIIEIEEKKKQTMTKFNEDDVFEKLNSHNPEDVLFALDLIKKLDVFTYLDEIKKIMIKNEKQTVRSFALMLLVSKEVDREMDYLSYKGLIKVNPKKLSKPFSGEFLNSLLRKMDNEFKNTTLSQTGAHLISSVLIYIYPHELSENLDEILGAIYLYSQKLMQEETIELSKFAQLHNLNYDSLKQYYDLIDVSSNDL